MRRPNADAACGGLSASAQSPLGRASFLGERQLCLFVCVPRSGNTFIISESACVQPEISTAQRTGVSSQAEQVLLTWPGLGRPACSRILGPEDVGIHGQWCLPTLPELHQEGPAERGSPPDSQAVPKPTGSADLAITPKKSLATCLHGFLLS